MVTVCNRLCNPLFERSAQSRQGCKPCNPVFCIALRYEPDGKLYKKSDKYIKRENYWVTRVTEQKKHRSTGISQISIPGCKRNNRVTMNKNHA